MEGRDIVMTAVFESGGQRLGFEDRRNFSTTAQDGDVLLPQATAQMLGDGGQAAHPGQARSLKALAGIAFLAFIGGVILNLMPCVLPVLSLKFLSIISHGGSARGNVRAGFLFAAAGIVFSFLVLAAVVILFRLGGTTLGWGVQFQQPAFLCFLIVVLTFFGASLWGIFDIPLPRFVAASLPTTHDHEPTLLGHFMTGMLAALLATPCTAPFVGTAVGFAMAGSTLDILVVFTAMGLGLASPYLLVTVFPGLVRFLPRPGAWMIAVKKILALALFAAAVWLLAVMGVIAGLMTAGAIAGLMAGLVLLLARKRHITDPTRAALSTMAIPLLVIAAFTLSLRDLPETEQARAAIPAAGKDSAWIAFDAARIPSLIAAGNIVLVDVTADWCLTCKANKKFVINSQDVQKALAEKKVVLMMADWTKPSQQIEDYLQSFNRFGIPFNVVYGPKARDGIVLPELLTQQAVLAALAKAR